MKSIFLSPNSILKRMVLVLSMLLIPFIGMQISNEINWSIFDFVLMGILLFSLFSLLHFFHSKFSSKKSRIILAGCAIFLFILIWAELAVGIFNSPISGS